MAAAVFLIIANRCSGFAWATASFTNASIRLYPCVMDLLRALRNGPPFSDEGDMSLALTSSVFSRSCLVLLPIIASLILTVLAAREYRFTTRGGLKSVAVYCLSLAVDIAVVLVDELTR